MLLDLYKLVRRPSIVRMPLEDFTTECFAGVLNHHPKVLESFTAWLLLPKGNYKVVTQKRYTLEEDVNCIVDLVIESESVICFIEHKVNSKEGWEQLNKYSKVLSGKLHKQTFLKYCTKHQETKQQNLHNFSQYRWHEIAVWLFKNHSQIPLVADFITFLKHHQMTLDTSITTETVIALNKFLQTYEVMDYHIREALPVFKGYFPNAILEKQESISKIKEHNRIARFTRNIVSDRSKHSELLYCIHFEEVKLQTQIWISIAHPLAETLYQKAADGKIFKYWKDNNGVGIYLDCKMYQFIEDQNSDQEIKNWFSQSFVSFKNFIDSNPDIEWDINTLQK